jgi:hypothetical protein
MNNDLSIHLQPREWLEDYQLRRYDQLSEKILRVLDHFEAVTYLELSVEGRYFLNVFVATFLFLFLQPDYVLGDRYVTTFIHHNHTIANLLAISDLRHCDAHLAMLRVQPQNYVKILTLYSARNTIELPEAPLFATSKELASLWLSRYLAGWGSGLGDRTAYQKIRAHLAQLEPAFEPLDHFAELYTHATAIDGERERPLKQQIHRGLQKYGVAASCPPAGKPNPQRIAIVTQFWHPDHPIYRGFARWVIGLCRHYEVDLWHLGVPSAATAGFRTVSILMDAQGQLHLEVLGERSAMVVCFLEVGRSRESLWLAHQRLGPIQVACLGHPATTAGTQVDYFISGGDVEVGRGAEQCYGERLVLLPNAGLEFTVPPWDAPPPPPPSDTLVLLCPWEMPALNHPLLQLLHRILREAQVPLSFRFLVGSSLNRYNDYLVCHQDIAGVLGDRFALIPTKTYAEWRSQIAQGHLCLDAYPMGSPWAIAESLNLRIPAICLEGRRWYNRASAWLLRQHQCPELVVKSPSDYAATVLHLMHDPDARQKIADRLGSCPPLPTDGGLAFQRAIALLIQKHHLGAPEESRKPIRIH